MHVQTLLRSLHQAGFEHELSSGENLCSDWRQIHVYMQCSPGQEAVLQQVGIGGTGVKVGSPHASITATSNVLVNFWCAVHLGDVLSVVGGRIIL